MGRRVQLPPREFAREVAIIVAAILAYFLVRGFTEGSYAQAVDNAQHVVNFERAIGVYWEPRAQDLIVDQQWLVTFFNWVYIWGHWPVIAVVAVWLFVRHPLHYYVVRNALLVSGAIGLVIFVTFPVAPPRLAALGFDDTVTEYSHSYRVLQPPAFVNQYAAVPSLHFGWNMLLAGSVIFLCSNLLARVLAGLLTIAMALAVVLTANHFGLDVVVGAAVALTGLGIAIMLRDHPPAVPLGKYRGSPSE